LDREERTGEMFTWNTTERGESLELVGRLRMEGHPVLDKVYESWQTQTEYQPVLRGPEIAEYYKVLRPQMAFPDYTCDAVQYGYFFFFQEGGVYAWTGKEMKEEELQIYRRFTSVLSLTYKRYWDLQKAEAQALRAEQDLIEIKAARKKAEETLRELKATQQQLIQREKMASLGELTAGIAHEIQNPLNFVNNFAAVNSELVAELRQEARAGNIEEVISLAESIGENETRINYHGQRADAIVKNMLQHAGGAAGERQPTDMNALVEEHLRLAYHSYRAKDNDFAADLTTCYDAAAGPVHVVPQEIGRVLLNLFTNAFYAVQQKKQRFNEMYEPLVSVSTKKEGNTVVIVVGDNGVGIPGAVTEKIFQPFFTTKPTGEGTGLGLSLSYDIITKGHGGNLMVHSTEGEGSEFVIELAVT
jgi:C4-dicarboxylate-specific signal transduction histidine kinase